MQNYPFLKGIYLQVRFSHQTSWKLRTDIKGKKGHKLINLSIYTDKNTTIPDLISY